MAGERPEVTIDTSRAHPARVYDYWLGGKDNISQVVRVTLCSALTLAIQRREAVYSKTGPVAVAILLRTCMGFNVWFDRRGFLTLA
jgi:S-adenosyl methyltransferase